MKQSKERERNNIIFTFFISILLGLLSGLFYFGGLWLTLNYIRGGRFSVFVAILSFFIRTAAIFAVLLFVIRFGEWMSVLFWLAGLIIARIVLSRLLDKGHWTFFSPGRSGQSKNGNKEL